MPVSPGPWKNPGEHVYLVRTPVVKPGHRRRSRSARPAMTSAEVARWALPAPNATRRGWRGTASLADLLPEWSAPDDTRARATIKGRFESNAVPLQRPVHDTLGVTSGIGVPCFRLSRPNRPSPPGPPRRGRYPSMVEPLPGTDRSARGRPRGGCSGAGSGCGPPRSGLRSATLSARGRPGCAAAPLPEA